MGIWNVTVVPGFLLIVLILKLKLIVISNVYFKPGKFSKSLAKLFIENNEKRYSLDIFLQQLLQKLLFRLYFWLKKKLDKTRYSEIEKTIHESIFEIAIEEAFELHMFFFN